ncbi:S8 family peptidase [Fredinandcohnia sp. 179-A 10B2 NHS]|uniref:S8 family peptidase n=1 Tax=Fredinandcohnia sp. 179-A 10B2 NHS TaxID=3235176 RepID=UPI0039A00D83
MFGFSMVQFARNYGSKMDSNLRKNLVNLYRPFKWTPCIFHNTLEKIIKKTRKFEVIIECADQKGVHESVKAVMDRHYGCKIKHEFKTIDSCSATVTAAGLEELLQTCSTVKRVYLNSEVKALLNVATPSARADQVVRNGSKLTGDGVTIAVIDTGIYPHQDLEGRIIDFVDLVNSDPNPYDDNGHGTHCAGDAAGNGAASGGKYVAPAPNANVVGIKVLDKLGSGSLDTVMRGVEWCILNNQDATKPRIDIISMSLGASAQRLNNEDADPMVQIVEKAWDSGIVVVVAAGNEGDEPNTIASPGISNKVITVGALDDRNTLDGRMDDAIAQFSSRGPTFYNVPKPDIVAPGVNIISLRSPNSYLDKFQKANRVEQNYFTLSGTSMATPICAGVVALMIEYRKKNNLPVSPTNIKGDLLSGADKWKGIDYNTYGAGYINAQNAIK